MKPYYQDDQVTLYHGDAFEVLRGMPDVSVDCCITSPPYFGLRDYGVEGQYGLEKSPAEYVETMRSLFAEVRRVLTDDGTLWLNLGDSYSSEGGKKGVGVNARVGTTLKQRDSRTRPNADLPVKNLLGIPWRVTFALQDDGWILRNEIIWSKPNAMPESVTDRLSNRHEHLFMFSKSKRYWFDLDPIREPTVYQSGAAALSFDRDSKECDVPGQSMRQHRAGRSWAERKALGEPGKYGLAGQAAVGTGGFATNQGRNPGDVWTIPTQPFTEAHFAVMPQALAERAVLAGCKPGGSVLDPFSGSGTVGLVANKHSRRYVGIDLNADYLDLSLRTRFGQMGLAL